jgi:hypothetical protein
VGYSEVGRGHVDSIARAINVSNAHPNNRGVANVNPIFTWVRLAQRIPVRIHIDEVPTGVVLSAGMTATVEIDLRASSPVRSEILLLNLSNLYKPPTCILCVRCPRKSFRLAISGWPANQVLRLAPDPTMRCRR